MIYSMTGYSKVSLSQHGYAVTVNMKSLNSRNLDIITRLPKDFMHLENEIRQIVRSKLRRGRVEMFLNIDVENPCLKAPPIHPDVFRSYWNQLTLISLSTPGIPRPTMGDLLRISHIFDYEKNEEGLEIIEKLILEASEAAVDELLAMRSEEGKVLEEACKKHLETLENIIGKIESRREILVKSIKDKILEKVKQLLEDASISMDENRLLMEAAILAERSDITEEIVRLKGHVEHFRKLISQSQPADGRQLDFLVQEMHREANTLGAKSSDMDLSVFVVKLKTEIARLREQVQNIE